MPCIAIIGHQQQSVPVIAVDDTLNATVDDTLDTPTEWAELGVEFGAITSPPPSRQESPLTEYSADAHCQRIEAPPVYAREIRQVNTSNRSACFTVDALAVAMKHHVSSPDLDDMIDLLRRQRIHQQGFCQLVRDRFGPGVLINALHEIRMAVTSARQAAEDDAQGDENPADTALMPVPGEPRRPPAGSSKSTRKRPRSFEHGGLPPRSSKSLRLEQSPDDDDLSLEPLRPCPISALDDKLSLEPLKAQPCGVFPMHAAAA